MSIMSQRGFVLLIVAGMLGILALIAISFVSKSRLAIQLSREALDTAAVRMVARSGLEHAQSICADYRQLLSFPTRIMNRVGPGKYVPGGNFYALTMKDFSGKIDINDCIDAGVRELAASYDASQVNTYSDDSVVFYSGFASAIPITGESLYPDGHWESKIILEISENTPGITIGDTVLFDGLEHNITDVGVDANFDKLKLTVDYHFENDIVNFPIAIKRLLPIKNPSGFLNLRVRLLLNAYGESHRFLANLGVPTFDRGKFYAGERGAYGTEFPTGCTIISHLDDPSPALDEFGEPLASDNESESRALGDRIIGARPPGGYSDLRQIEVIVNSWGDKYLKGAEHSEKKDYLDGKPFFEMARNDLTINNFIDRSMIRQRFEIGTRPTNLESRTYKPWMFEGRGFGKWKFVDFWTHHSASPINFVRASPLVRSAIFYSLANVGYILESAKSVPNYYSGEFPTLDLTERQFTADAKRAVGVGGPIFKAARLENGAPNSGLANRFMSLRDALVLGYCLDDYSSSNGRIRNFDEFRDFLNWKELHGVPYEKVEPEGVLYDPDPQFGGYMVQNYAALTLPHVLSCIKRIPGWYGAPQALLSEVSTTSQFKKGVPYTILSSADVSSMEALGAAYPTRKAEDFVFRFIHPKILFLDSGVEDVHVHAVISGDMAGHTVGSHDILCKLDSGIRFRYLRSQQDFLSVNVTADTSPEILIGPGFKADRFVKNTHPFLGLIGLKDFFNEGSDGATIRVTFDNGGIALERDSPLPQGTGFDTSMLGPEGRWEQMTPEQDDFTGLVAAWKKFRTYDKFSHKLQTHQGEYPFPNEGFTNSGISPFNGIRMNSESARAFPENLIGEYLMWRPWAIEPDPPQMFGFYSKAIFDMSKPVGMTVNRGLMTTWFRIPTGHREPAMAVVHSGSNSYATQTDGTFQAIASMNFWNRYYAPETVIFSGWGDTWVNGGTWQGVNWSRAIYFIGSETILGKIKPGLPITFGPLKYKITKVHAIAGLYPPFIVVEIDQNLSADLSDAIDIWAAPIVDSPTKLLVGCFWDRKIQRFKIRAYCQTHREEPISSSLYKAMNFDSITPIGDEGAIDHVFHLNYPPFSPEENLDYNSWLSLNASHRTHIREITLTDAPECGPGTWHRIAMGWNAQYGIHDTDESFYLKIFDQSNEAEYTRHFSTELPYDRIDGEDPNMVISLGESYQTNTGDPTNRQYHPRWRLNSCLDNFALYLGENIPENLQSRNDVGFLDFEQSRRHNVRIGNEPKYVMNPNFLPPGSKIVSIGGRIYEPRDANNLFPRVDIRLIENGTEIFPTESALGGTAPDSQRTEQVHFYDEYLYGPDAQVWLQYSAMTPTGTPLVINATDQWAEIPWIKEIHIRYRLKGNLKISDWGVGLE